MKRAVTVARTVARQAAHVKPAAHHKKAATGHAHKHHRAAKHHAKPRKHQGGVARGLATGAEVACCAAEALAASLRLSGLSVGDADVLGLFWRAGGDPEAGAPILAVLEAASESGLAGVRLAGFDLVGDLEEGRGDGARSAGADDVAAGLILRAEQLDRVTLIGDSAPQLTEFGRVDGHLVAAEGLGDAFLGHGASLILGVDLPGPHTVLATPEGWWSWGELWCPCEFPDAVIEEAWAVTW